MSDVGRGFFFFFSSRRRHTRLQGDWSSDVCSSDLSGDSAKARRVNYRGRVSEGRGSDGTRDHGGDGGDEVVVCIFELGAMAASVRSEERRVGEEGRSWGAPEHLKKKK